MSEGIFCLEGLWDNDLKKKSTVEPILQLLELNNKIPYIHKDCATVEEFNFYATKWSRKAYAKYPILYLAFHGEEGSIVFPGTKYSLDDIASLLEGKCKSSIIVIGSCSVLNIDKRHLKRFILKTGALAICGYKIIVDWMRSTAFEVLLLSELQKNKFDRRGIDSMNSKLKSLSSSFKDLEFCFVSQKDLNPKPK